MKISHLKLPIPITEKRRNKVKYLTWNFIRLKFVKKTSMPNSVKSLGYIKCHSSSSPRPVKSPSNSIRYNCEKISSWLRRPKTILEIRKKTTFLLVINNPIIYKFFIDFTNHRKKTKQVVVFSSTPSHNLKNKTLSDWYGWKFRLTVL